MGKVCARPLALVARVDGPNDAATLVDGFATDLLLFGCFEDGGASCRACCARVFLCGLPRSPLPVAVDFFLSEREADSLLVTRALHVPIKW